MITIVEHSKDLAVIARDGSLKIRVTENWDAVHLCLARSYDLPRHNKVFLSLALSRKWPKIGKTELLDFLDRKKSNIGKVDLLGDRMRIHFWRCLGANNLYQKVLRKSAEHKFPKATVATHTAMAELLHDMFKHMHNGGKTTTTLKPSEFRLYYEACQHDCILMFGVSGMDEDEGEFDHGFKPQ